MYTYNKSTFFQFYPVVCQTRLVCFPLWILALYIYFQRTTEYFACWLKEITSKMDKNVSTTNFSEPRRRTQLKRMYSHATSKEFRCKYTLWNLKTRLMNLTNFRSRFVGLMSFLFLFSNSKVYFVRLNYNDIEKRRKKQRLFLIKSFNFLPSKPLGQWLFLWQRRPIQAIIKAAWVVQKVLC